MFLGLSAEAWLPIVLAFLLVAVFGGRFSRQLVSLGMIDWPNDRRVNQRQTPRGGGGLMALSLLSALALMVVTGQLDAKLGAVSLIILLSALLGWIDDISPQSITLRLLGQGMIGIAMVLLVGLVEMVRIGPWQLGLPGYLWVSVSVLAFVWMVNLHNFMDGSDGLAAAQGVFSFAAYVWLFAINGSSSGVLLAAVLTSICIGFLLWNRPPAHLFMGDSGSLMMGAGVCSLAYWGLQTGQVSLSTLVVISSVFIVDATATLVRRVVEGEQWYNAHSTHAFQLLVSFGWSHARVLWVYMALNLGVVAPVLYLIQRWPQHDLWFLMALLVGLTIGWWQVQKRAQKTGQQQG